MRPPDLRVRCDRCFKAATTASSLFLSQAWNWFSFRARGRDHLVRQLLEAQRLVQAVLWNVFNSNDDCVVFDAIHDSVGQRRAAGCRFAGAYVHHIVRREFVLGQRDCNAPSTLQQPSATMLSDRLFAGLGSPTTATRATIRLKSPVLCSSSCTPEFCSWNAGQLLQSPKYQQWTFSVCSPTEFKDFRV